MLQDMWSGDGPILGHMADKEDGDSTFSDAMKKVSDRKKGLDDLFKDAKKKADEKGYDEKPEDRDDFWD